jgi:translation initiation factor IF-2
VNLPTNPNESLRKRNPHIYGVQINPAVRPMVPARKERNEIQTLDGGVKISKQSKGDVEIVVALIACRNREIDDDSNVYSLAPLRDAIAASLGLNDADKRIRWAYSQVIHRGTPGVIVKIEHLKT